MTRLPHPDKAFLDRQKLESYCLDPTHPRGRHKARVFKQALGVTRDDTTWLAAQLMDAAPIPTPHSVHEH